MSALTRQLPKTQIEVGNGARGLGARPVLEW